MRIECPSCAARYEVPETRLAPGRAVRCARCGSDWVPLQAEAGQAEAVRLAQPVASDLAHPLAGEHPGNEHLLDDGRLDDGRLDEPAAVPPRRANPFVQTSRPADPSPEILLTADTPKRRRPLLAAAWAVSVAIVAAVAVLAVLLREPIARAWPPSLRVYDALNLSTGAR